jgi:hypothetical protein
MRNRFGWVTEGSTPVPVETLGAPSDQFMQIRFIVPDKREPEPLLDVTPQTASPYADAKPDLSRPAIEPPRPRQTTPFGSIWERPKPTDWMG